MVKDCESSLSRRGVIAPLARGVATPFADDAVEVTAARLDVGRKGFARWQRGSRTRSDKERVVSHSIATGAGSSSPARGCDSSSQRGWACGLNRSRWFAGTRQTALAPRYADVGLRFNVSHSEDVAVYAFATGREIGIDVEAVRVIRDADDIAARFFSRARTRHTSPSTRATSRWVSSIAGRARKPLSRRSATGFTIH